MSCLPGRLAHASLAKLEARRNNEHEESLSSRFTTASRSGVTGSQEAIRNVGLCTNIGDNTTAEAHDREPSPSGVSG